MKEKKKIIFMIMIVLLIIAVVAAGTYAFYKWRSTSSIDVDINFDNSDNVVVTFDGGSSITGKITPTEYVYQGRVKKMSVGYDSALISNDNTFSLYLKTNSLSDDLKVDYFKWQLTSCDLAANHNCASSATVNVGGNFSITSMNSFIDQESGDLLLLSNQSIPFHLDLYLYLWIDANVDNDISIGNKDINFDIYAKGTSVGSYQEGS